MNKKKVLEKIFVHPLSLIPSEIGVFIRMYAYRFIFRKMGCNVRIKESVVLKHLYNLEIGDCTNINQFCFINAMGGVKIGKFCEIAPSVALVSFNYRVDKLPIPYTYQGKEKKPIILGDNIWLGTKVTVVAGVTIGENSIIGANSVVTNDIPPNCMAVGSPAKIIKVFKDGKWQIMP